MKKKFEFMPIIRKAENVIDSCETIEHLETARNYNRIVDRWMLMQIKKNGGILENFKAWEFYMDATTHLTRCFDKKLREMDLLL